MKNNRLIMLSFFIISYFFSLFTGCNQQREYEYYCQSNITLDRENHPNGYGQNQCFYCHIKANIHQVDRYGDPLFDSAKELVETDGLNSCSLCHGDNGVP